MLETVDSPSLKGMLDTIPVALAGEEIGSYFERLKEDLIHIHFVDGNPAGHLVWGEGKLPVDLYMDTLNQYGYKGALTLEFTSMQYVVDVDLAIETSLKHLQPYFA